MGHVIVKGYGSVLHVTRSEGFGPLRSAVRSRVDQEGLRPLSARIGIPVGQLRSLIAERSVLSSTVESVVEALGLEFYVGPPRRRGQSVNERLHSQKLERPLPPDGITRAEYFAQVFDSQLGALLGEIAEMYEKARPAERRFLLHIIRGSVASIDEWITAAAEAGDPPIEKFVTSRELLERGN